MVTINIPETLARQLEALAQQEQRSIDDIATSILEKHTAEVLLPEDDEAPLGTLAALIKAADEADIRSGTRDTSEHSREILNTDYPKYLARKYDLDKSETN